MGESEKAVMEALSTLTEKLLSLEKKVDSYGGDLGKVQEKVDLVMQSISLVQQEQVKVAKSLKLQMGGTAQVHLDDSVIGPTPSTSSTSTAGQHPPPPPPPPSTCTYAIIRFSTHHLKPALRFLFPLMLVWIMEIIV
jgi:hypothetical protein